MELYKIFSIIGLFFIVLALTGVYRFIKVVKKLDQNKTVEEVGLEKTWKKSSSMIGFWFVLGVVFLSYYYFFVLPRALVKVDDC